MVFFQSSSRTAATVSLIASIMSFVSCGIVLLSIHFDTNRMKSYHLQLVQRLLLCDFAIAAFVIMYFFMQIILNSTELKDSCKVYLPLVIFLFIGSYGWTVMLAFRFRDSHVGDAKEKLVPPLPLWAVWAVALVVALPLFIAAMSSSGVTYVESNSSDINQSCTFDHDASIGVALDIALFQAPLLASIVATVYAYAKGLWALRNTPHSVIARQMRRAGGYLCILLIVWVPNIIYNFLTIYDGNNSSYPDLLNFIVTLTSLQGFLNVCVYVWSNPNMRRWLCMNLFCFRNNHLDPAATRQEEAWLREAFSFSEQNKDALTKSLVREPDTSSSSMVSNPIANSEVSDSFGSSDQSVRSDVSRPKSILAKTNADGERAANERKATRWSTQFSNADLDHEKYVRFGENSTRTISVHSSRGSDIELAQEESM